MWSNEMPRPLGRMLLATGIALILAPSLARGACTVNLSVDNIDISWDLNYTYQAVTYTISKTSVDACDYGIAFSRGGASNYTRRMVGPGGVILPYQLYKEVSLTNVLRYPSDITGSNDVILGSFAAGVVPAQQFTFYLQVPLATATSPALKPYGTYTDTFDVSAYEGTDPVAFATPMTTSPVTVTATLPKIVQISIGNAGDGFDPGTADSTIAFGALSSGMIAQRELKVRTNAGYSVSFTSANQGKMAHTDPLVTTEVPYTVSVNAVPLDLSGGAATAATQAGQTSIEGNQNPIMVRIGNLDGALSGAYEDTITITVSSTD